ncbi:hypothetical protein K8R42_03620, partial [bacterium]|nr:hypothetical protein [bacterium]
MPSLSDQTKTYITSDKWSDNLLVKDKNGKIDYLQSRSSALKKNILTSAKSNFGAVSPGQLTPNDDSFAPIQNISGSSQGPAKFVFHPDDQAEIEELAHNMPRDSSKKYSIEKIVDKLIEKQNLSFNEEMKKRFVDLIYNFFRNRKNAIVAREILSIKILSNNKKLAPTTVDNIISVIKGIKVKIDAAGGLVVRFSEIESKPIPEKFKAKGPVEDLVIDPDQSEGGQSGEKQSRKEGALIAPISEELKTAKRIVLEDENQGQKPEEEIQKALKEIAGLQKSSPVSPKLVEKKVKPKEGLKSKVKPLEVVVEKKSDFVLPSEKPKEVVPSVQSVNKSEPVKPAQEISLPKVSRPVQQVKEKKQITDVVTKRETVSVPADKFKSKHEALSGPVQELQNLTLTNFRRLGNSSKERIKKILDKINLLEQ